jgi:signal transduction histidine kinase
VVLEIDIPFPGPIVRSNVNQLQQVLTNLVTNAWEAAEGKTGNIRLAVKTVFPEAIPAERRFPAGWRPEDQAYACLEVADTCCGRCGSGYR